MRILFSLSRLKIKCLIVSKGYEKPKTLLWYTHTFSVSKPFDECFARKEAIVVQGQHVNQSLGLKSLCIAVHGWHFNQLQSEIPKYKKSDFWNAHTTYSRSSITCDLGFAARIGACAVCSWHAKMDLKQACRKKQKGALCRKVYQSNYIINY